MDFVDSILAEASSARELWELGSFQATVAAALITLISAVATGGLAVWQWHKELRWKQAELSRELLDEIFDHTPSDDAWRMVDGETRYKDQHGIEREIDMEVVRKALATPWNESVGTEVYVRWCFDALLYYLERLEQSVQIKLVCVDDLIAPTSYYIALMAKDKKLFQDYARRIRFDRALKFMDRFPEWKKAA